MEHNVEVADNGVYTHIEFHGDGMVTNRDRLSILGAINFYQENFPQTKELVEVFQCDRFTVFCRKME